VTAPSADLFSDLDAYLALPRLTGLALSPDGRRLVTSVATLDAEAVRWVTALWELDPAGERPAARLTRSRKGEASPVFLPGGDVLFTSARPDPDGTKTPDDDAPAALWRLPAHGEAAVVATRPGGIGGVVVARDAGTVVVSSRTLPGSGPGDDEERRKARKDAKVRAVLHTGYPVRYWDADLGPDAPRLLATTVPDDGAAAFTDLTPAPGRALDEAEYDLTPDGFAMVTTWRVPEPHGSLRVRLVVVDTTTGDQRVLLDEPGHDVSGPRVSPDGRQVAVTLARHSTPAEPEVRRLMVLPLDGSAPPREVAPGWDRWALDRHWTPDSAALLVTADEDGRSPVFRIEGGAVTRLTGDAAAYTDLQVSPDGRHVYALRSAYDAPPAVVRLDASTPDQTPVLLPGPAEPPALPGRLEEVETTAADGSRVRSWLVLPEGGGPHPLVLWIHGGPLGSWNAWSWRWCPWLLAARGYAVLLPDPALSTGYGCDFVARGWGDWGGAPYDDLMRAVDAALERPDLDAGRTAAMGGSFGGYMANWVAGHTDRFRAIVTHASLWALDQFGPTTDATWYWRREMTPEMAAANDPSAHADAIRTPMLVVHGDKDYRVPVGEALRLWWDLCSRAEDPATMPHRFLYFPDENHWVSTPQHAKVWYETVLSFLGVHVLGEPETVGELLR
jgi:dipeptidyl aminopeptidase/acylaminoacyl peptidase